MAGALIITAEMRAEDLAWLDRLRQAHFPAERNFLRAHLTMFHALPPSAESEVKRSLARSAARRPPRALLEGLMNLGGGVAFRVASDDLDFIRQELAADFHGMLSSQDAAGWRPHVTIQNKVSAKEALALLNELQRDFRPRPLAISGLGLYRYLDGPWEAISRYPFRG